MLGTILQPQGMGAIVAEGGCNEYSIPKGNVIVFQVRKSYRTLLSLSGFCWLYYKARECQ
jgi:hypothetical protein